MNIYKEILEQNINKLLNLYDLDPSSQTLGYGDRLYWGWKVSDFVNATMQGGVHSLAIAIKLNLIDNKEFVLTVIDQAIRAIDRIKDKYGSLQEAYPSEHSFCVTALIAFDVLSAVRHLEGELSVEKKTEYLDIVRPLISFITKNNEQHAFISNHLATAVAAITLWNKLTNENNEKYKELLVKIYRHQSNEGWYREYEGADPGYETLCLYYLASAYDNLQDDELKQSINRSASFLSYFIHPDHTIGGLYGSRNTEVYYPGGIVALSNLSPDFVLLAKELEEGVAAGNHLLPQDIDTGNYIPCLNSYAFAALHYKENNAGEQQAPYNGNFEKEFPDAGIYIKSTDRYYAIVNYKKGGTMKVFDKTENILDMEDGGLFGELKNGTKFSTQQFDNNISFADNKIKSSFYKIYQSHLTPFQLIVFRLLALTFFKSVAIGNMFKRFVVKKLMTGKNKIDGKVIRKFEFGEEKILVQEGINPPKHSEYVKHIGKFKAIHMASSGYYLKQTQELPAQSKIVEYNIK